MKAARGGLAAKRGEVVLVVGRALQQHGKLPSPGRPVDVGAQRHAVARLHRHIALDDWVGSGLSNDWKARQAVLRQGQAGKDFFQHEVSSMAKAESILPV
jgi:hypothetical protein